MDYPTTPGPHISNRSKILLGIIFSLLLFSLLYRLNDFPTLWWDEGWTLSAARNWIEHGHLGNYRDGLPVPPGIPLRFPVAVSAAVSMLMFGIGTWQGRLPGVIYTIFVLVSFMYITSKLYNHRTALAALIFVIVLSPISFQPILMGRQVMAEIPMMFFLLGGYCMVWLALTRSATWCAGAILFFGIAIHTKLQVPPFWLASIILAMWTAIIYHNRRYLKVLTIIASGSIGLALLVFLLQNRIMPGSFDDPALLKILLNTSVFNLQWPIRWKALYIALIFTLPQILGLLWAGRSILRNLFTHRAMNLNTAHPEDVARKCLLAAIWGLGTSWLVWYVFMSMYWIRYIFPAYFIGWLFVSAWIGKMTDNFDIKNVIQHTIALLLKREFSKANLKSAAVVLAFGVALGLTIGTLRIGLAPSPWKPEAIATYIRNNIPQNSRVETYESELFFLVPEMIYLYPPDIVSMQLYRRADIDAQTEVDYNLLNGKPDYLIVGPFAQTYGLYDRSIIDDTFELNVEVGGYQVYHARP